MIHMIRVRERLGSRTARSAGWASRERYVEVVINS